MKSDATVTDTQKKLKVSPLRLLADFECVCRKFSYGCQTFSRGRLLHTAAIHTFSFSKIIHSQQTFFVFFSKDAEPAEVDKRMSASYWDAKM